MLENILGIIFSIPFAFSILRITTPILFAALAAVVADRAGRHQHRPRGHHDDLRPHRRHLLRLDPERPASACSARWSSACSSR